MRKGILLLIMLFYFQTAYAVGKAVDREVFVPDEKTAIAIAKAVLIPIFGESFAEHRLRQPFSKTHTFYATSYQDRWVVEDAPPARLAWSEPVLRVEIDKKRGCILQVSEY
jgi:hypothetical protein